MARRLEHLKLLNMDRWRAHLQDRAERDREVAEERKVAPRQPDGGAVAAPVPESAAAAAARVPPAAPAVPTPVPTASELFKRADPFQRGHIVKPYSAWTSSHDYGRVGAPSTGAGWRQTRLQVLPASSDDAASRTRLIPHSKYHVPVTSVTRKQGDCKLFLCCGWRWTAAQWIWALNCLCFLAHTTMIFVTLHFAYWRHGLDPSQDTKHVEIPIYRIRNIPTQHMLDTNQSHWSEGWNLTSTNPNSGLFLYDNGMPINLASLVIAFFATSAVFHLFACVVGAFERWWGWYWRQMDDALLWWRWAEYGVSAALMAIALGIVLGIREQNTVTRKLIEPLNKQATAQPFLVAGLLALPGASCCAHQTLQTLPQARDVQRRLCMLSVFHRASSSQQRACWRVLAEFSLRESVAGNALRKHPAFGSFELLLCLTSPLRRAWPSMPFGVCEHLRAVAHLPIARQRSRASLHEHRR